MIERYKGPFPPGPIDIVEVVRPKENIPVAPAKLPPHKSGGERTDVTYIPLADLEIGEAYLIEARNINIGVWDGRKFHGIRAKFGQRFIDSEIHWDLDPRNGTAKALIKLK